MHPVKTLEHKKEKGQYKRNKRYYNGYFKQCYINVTLREEQALQLFIHKFTRNFIAFSLTLFIVLLLLFGALAPVRAESRESLNSGKLPQSSEIRINFNNKFLETDVPPIIREGRTLVPFRAIFETLGLEVQYIEQTKTIIGTKEDTEIVLRVDSDKAVVNGKEVNLEVPAVIVKDRTMIPVRFIAENIGLEVGWNDVGRIVNIMSLTASPGTSAPENVTVGTHTVNINKTNKTVNVVTVDLNNQDINLEVVTANDRVGGSENFQSMIDRKKPVAAINANFFDAYDSLEPYGSIVKDGRFTYLEGENTSLLIKDKNKVDIDYFKVIIKGYLDGKRVNEWNDTKQAMDFNLFDVWYINNLPRDGTGVYVYTPERGNSILLEKGTAIEVVNNRITKITKNPNEAIIPPNGYIIYYGPHAADDAYINDRFSAGRTVELVPANGSLKDKPAAEISALTDLKYMISAGPYLVNDNKVIADAASQGFKEDKITVGRAQRSALGITKDNKLKLVTGGNLNITELAHVMLDLGCYKAMNLDGGASSALYAKGKIITRPGRELNTVLMLR
jgi:exopolysaccharide biosynthesis protein